MPRCACSAFALLVPTVAPAASLVRAFVEFTNRPSLRSNTIVDPPGVAAPRPPVSVLAAIVRETRVGAEAVAS